MATLQDFLQSMSNSAASNVSAPVDGINWLLRKAGLPVSEAPVMGSDWLAQRGYTRPVQQNAASLAGDAAGMIGPMLAVAKAPQLARGLLQMGDNLAAPTNLNPQTGAVVWHGSPHKFDKFDSAKIGTGEGNQAYGHGLYFADSPDVAKGYAESLAMRDSGQTPAQIQAAIKTTMDTMQGPRRAQVLAGLKADLASAKQSTRQGSSVYQVDLPDDQIAKMLDWDKPLSAQSAFIQDAMQKSGIAKNAGQSNSYSDAMEQTGQDIFYALKKGNPDTYWGPKYGLHSSQTLKNIGIPGVRYLDAGHRAIGGGKSASGTSNYVVFPGNEGLLSIMERNGQALTAAKKPFVYPQAKALATAQLNAAKSIDEGGLGLLANNTPAQRAQAMGFTDDAYHGTPNDGIVRSRQFKDSMLGKSTQVNDARKGHFTADRGEAASEYIWSGGGTDGGNVLPLMVSSSNRSKTSLPGEWGPGKYDAALDAARAGGFDGLDIAGTTTLGKPGNYQVTFDPKNIRSRFAAFDPARRNEADLLGRADPELLKWMAGAGLLGTAGYSALQDR